MSTSKPHYLLFCEGSIGGEKSFPQEDASRWRFVLEDVATGNKVVAWDHEEIFHPDRISLMAVIRGLEALEQPSKVTLVTTNRYVARGLQYGLPEWRENDFCWEHFGSVQPIRNRDLWRRVDVALRYHEVTCRWMAYDSQQDKYEGDHRDVPVETKTEPALAGPPERLRSRSFSASTASESGESELSPIQHSSEMKRVAPSWKRNRGKSTTISDSVSRFESSETLDADQDFSANSALDIGPSSPLQPGRRVWRFLLGVDTMLSNALRSLLMLDPKPNHFRVEP